MASNVCMHAPVCAWPPAQAGRQCGKGRLTGGGRQAGRPVVEEEEGWGGMQASWPVGETCRPVGEAGWGRHAGRLASGRGMLASW